MEKQSHRWEVFIFCNQNQLILMPPLSVTKEKAQLCLDTLDAIFTEEAKAEA